MDLRSRLVGGVYVSMVKSRDGVLSTGHLGWESLPCSANLSASLFPRMSTWDGTLINLMEPVCALRVSRRSSQRGTLETGPLLPVHPLSFHRRAAPVAPRKTYSLSVQIASGRGGGGCSSEDAQQHLKVRGSGQSKSPSARDSEMRRGRWNVYGSRSMAKQRVQLHTKGSDRHGLPLT